MDLAAAMTECKAALQLEILDDIGKCVDSEPDLVKDDAVLDFMASLPIWNQARG